MFLLGAVLVGGVLGFSADRVLAHDKTEHWARRERMYDDLGLTDLQRVRMDSLLDAQNCKQQAVMKPVRAQIDSIRKAGRLEMMTILTPAQQATLEFRRAEMVRRDSVEKARRDSVIATKKTTNTCRL